MVGNEETKKKIRKTRTARTFPASTFSEAVSFAKSVYQIGSGQPVRRITLFDELQKSPDSSGSRMAITNSGKYGLTKGSYTADFIELSPLGTKIVGENTSLRVRLETL